MSLVPHQNLGRGWYCSPPIIFLLSDPFLVFFFVIFVVFAMLSCPFLATPIFVNYNDLVVLGSSNLHICKLFSCMRHNISHLWSICVNVLLAYPPEVLTS